MIKPNGFAAVRMTARAPSGRAPRRVGPMRDPDPKFIVSPVDRRARRKGQRAARRVTRLAAQR